MRTGPIIIVVFQVPEAAHHHFDANRYGLIERDELIVAVREYFAGPIFKEMVIAPIKRYFTRQPSWAWR